MNHHLTTQFIGQKWIELPQTDSTNAYLKNLAKNGEPHGTVVIAQEQTAGRGRLGRSFYSPPESGLYCSMLLRPHRHFSDLTLLTAAAAVAVCNAVEQLGASPQIKWVNDVLLENKKFCGILTEGSFSPSNRLDYLVVGIGVNVGAAAFPPELSSVATSLARQGILTDCHSLAILILNCFEPLYEMILRNRTTSVLEKYEERLTMLHRTITVVSAAEQYQATAVGLDSSGGLIVERDGKRQTLRTGEISVRLGDEPSSF